MMFSVSEYLSRIEGAYLGILQDLEPMDKTITLWLGLDGLRRGRFRAVLLRRVLLQLFGIDFI